MHEDPNRNPVIVIPGLLGSKLVDLDTGKLFLIVGDAEKTKMTAQINPEGGIKIIKTGRRMALCYAVALLWTSGCPDI
jgi:hypothetical protein